MWFLYLLDLQHCSISDRKSLSAVVKLLATHAFNWTVLRVKFGLTGYEELLPWPWIDEYRDRENHKLSIIVHNVPASVATESAARIAHDNNYVTNITNIIDAWPVEILNITSLGKKLDDKPRLLKVQLSNLQQKCRILLHVYMLKCWENFQAPSKKYM